jgi:hypothetical protein
MSSVGPPASSPTEGASLVVRFGTAVGMAVLASLACAGPAAMRVSSAVADTGPGPPRVWLALAAAALAPMVAAIIVLRGAREGLRAFGGASAGPRAFGIGLWLASMFVAMSLLGSVLRATTHHHALAGVTFAFGALALAVASAVVCARITGILRTASPPLRRAIVLGLGGVAFVAIAWVGLRFARAVSHDPTSTAAAGTVIDVLAFALAALFASRQTLVARRVLALVGPPVAVVVAAFGLTTLRGEPSVRDAIEGRAPAFAPVAEIVSGR